MIKRKVACFSCPCAVGTDSACLLTRDVAGYGCCAEDAFSVWRDLWTSVCSFLDRATPLSTSAGTTLVPADIPYTMQKRGHACENRRRVWAFSGLGLDICVYRYMNT